MRRTRGLDSTRKVRPQIRKSINYITLAIFAPLLIIVGIAGFVIPAAKSLTSGATPYNLFHIFFGIVGLLILRTKKETPVIVFNIAFGLIDLYQVLANALGLPPQQYFLWTRVDDILHVVIGALLVGIGFYGLVKLRRP